MISHTGQKIEFSDLLNNCKGKENYSQLVNLWESLRRATKDKIIFYRSNECPAPGFTFFCKLKSEGIVEIYFNDRGSSQPLIIGHEIGHVIAVCENKYPLWHISENLSKKFLRIDGYDFRKMALGVKSFSSHCFIRMLFIEKKFKTSQEYIRIHSEAIRKFDCPNVRRILDSERQRTGPLKGTTLEKNCMQMAYHRRRAFNCFNMVANNPVGKEHTVLKRISEFPDLKKIYDEIAETANKYNLDQIQESTRFLDEILTKWKIREAFVVDKDF